MQAQAKTLYGNIPLHYITHSYKESYCKACDKRTKPEPEHNYAPPPHNSRRDISRLLIYTHCRPGLTCAPNYMRGLLIFDALDLQSLSREFYCQPYVSRTVHQSRYSLWSNHHAA